MLMGNGVGFWNTMPTLARISDMSVLAVNRFSPSRMISPSARWPGYSSNMRLNVRSSVDLPQPDGPMKAVTFFSWIDMFTLRIAWNLP
ncbi:hypothetical protein D3C87_638340 [compost metagenome]